MNQADSGDARQRPKWAKYKQYRRPHDHRASVYFTTNSVVAPLEEDQEPPVAMEVEEDAKPRHRSLIIELDSGEEDETKMTKTKSKAKATRRSNRLRGPRG